MGVRRQAVRNRVVVLVGEEALPHEEAAKIIVSERGTHFDPEIVDVFVEVQETFHRIRMLEDFRQHPESVGDLMAARGNGEHRAREGVEPQPAGAEQQRSSGG